MKRRFYAPPPRTMFILLRKALEELNKNDPLRMAGATAFFTTFALPPIVVIIIQGMGVIFDRRALRQQLLDTLEGILGADGRQQIGQVLHAFRMIANSSWNVILGFIFLLFVATTLFLIIKNSFNQ